MVVSLVLMTQLLTVQYYVAGIIEEPVSLLMPDGSGIIPGNAGYQTISLRNTSSLNFVI